MPVRVIALASIVFAAAAAPLHAVGQEGAHPCTAVENDLERLACYDEAFGRALSRASAQSEVRSTVGAVPTSAAAAQAREDFGLSEAAKRARDPDKARETMPESISAVVAKVVRRPTGEVLVTLDSQQVWEQAETGTIVMLKAGDSVTIRKAALGSYVLVTPSRVAVRVRRIR